MIIIFSPQVRSDALTLFKMDEALNINGVEVDFSPLPVGTKLPLEVCQNYSPFLISALRNEDNTLELTILLPHTSNATQAALFPQPVVNPSNGQIQIPS